ncbi:MAG: hypothetical protein ACRCV6_00440 [Formosimonas sp.]
MKQRGFALATVLLLLMIVALLVTALLNNQVFALRETTDVITSATRTQNAHNIHRTCLRQVRTSMAQGNSPDSPVVIHIPNATGVIGSTVSGQCTLTAGQLTDNPNAWVPHLRITSTYDGITEISDWRYTACEQPNSGSCTTLPPMSLKPLTGNNHPVTVRPQYQLNTPIQTAWRME